MMKSIYALLMVAACQAPERAAVDSSPAVANGKKVSQTQPFAGALAALVERDGDNPHAPYCSGVLVGPRVVATAAHCLGDSRVHVAFGLGMGSQVRVISGTGVRHEHYGAAYSEAFSFDLGLVYLDEAVPVFARPISMARGEDYKIGDKAVFAGYGSIARDVGDRRLVPNEGYPMQAKMRIRDIFRKGDEASRDDMSLWGLISVSSDDKRSGGCTGDSGGPLIVWRRGKPLVAGIANGSPRGGQCDDEFVFTNLDFYGQWLESKISGF